MMNSANVSDELLNAFVDDELAMDEKNEVLGLAGIDANVKTRVCELRGAKEMVKHAYSLPVSKRPAVEGAAGGLRGCRSQGLRRLAAYTLLLLLGGVSGWFAAMSSASSGDPFGAYISRVTKSNYVAGVQGNIIFQVSTANPVRLKAALDEAESLLQAGRKMHRRFRVEIIANVDGINLLRSDVSPYATRIGLLKAKYPNLDILACGQTINNLQKKGVTVHLLPNIVVAGSAAEEISKRLTQGWDFARI